MEHPVGVHKSSYVLHLPCVVSLYPPQLPTACYASVVDPADLLILLSLTVRRERYVCVFVCEGSGCGGWEVEVYTDVCDVENH